MHLLYIILDFYDVLPEAMRTEGEEGGDDEGGKGHAYHGDEFLSVS